MTYRPLGDSGLMVSTVGLGCNNFGMRIDAEATAAVVDAAIDAGITLFDTSDSYGASEEFLAPTLKGRRDRVVLATKFGSDLKGALGPDWDARAVTPLRAPGRRAVTHPTRHRPHRPLPTAPTRRHHARSRRRCRCSPTWSTRARSATSARRTSRAWQVADADWTANSAGLERFISAQNEYSLLRTGAEAELIPACEQFGIGLLPYFPLASGLLTGKYRRGDAPPEGGRIAAWGMTGVLNDDNFDVIEALEAFAAERGITLLDVAMGGLAARPTVASVIAGATSPEQVRANAAAGLWEPSDDDADALAGLTADLVTR